MNMNLVHSIHESDKYIPPLLRNLFRILLKPTSPLPLHALTFGIQCSNTMTTHSVVSLTHYLTVLAGYFSIPHICSVQPVM